MTFQVKIFTNLKEESSREGEVMMVMMMMMMGERIIEEFIENEGVFEGA